MSDLRAIADLYAEVDDFLEALRDKASADGATTLRERIEHKQRMNDQAYFVLAWGQLEADIVDACRTTIRHAQTHSSWRDRRAWTLYNPDDRSSWVRNQYPGCGTARLAYGTSREGTIVEGLRFSAIATLGRWTTTIREGD